MDRADYRTDCEADGAADRSDRMFTCSAFTDWQVASGELAMQSGGERRPVTEFIFSSVYDFYAANG